MQYGILDVDVWQRHLAVGVWSLYPQPHTFSVPSGTGHASPEFQRFESLPEIQFSNLFHKYVSPRFARPMPRRGLIRRRIAIMPRTEALAMLGTRFLYLHVRITESHLDDRALRCFDIHRALFLLTRSVEGLVQSDFLALVLSHINLVLLRTAAKPEYPSSSPVSCSSET